MKRLLPSILLAGFALAACGESTKATEGKTSYFISADNAARVTRLAFRTAALVGRHAVYPNGNNTAAPAPKCPSTGAENKIKIVPSCVPDFTVAGAVDCTISETYECPEVSGAVTTTVAMRADELSYSVAPKNYQEGNEAMGFIRYNGSVAALTKPDGTTSYQEELSFIARGASDTEDTVVSSASDVTVSTAAGKLQFDGSASLQITGMGEGKVVMNGVDFGDCKIGPQSGTMDIALVGIERAMLEFTGCGAATLHHFKAGVMADAEEMSADNVMYSFGTSLTDVTYFKGVTLNTAPSAAALSGTRWCVPVSATTPNLSKLLGTASGVYSMAFDAVTVATTKPALECLTVQENAALGTVALHTVVVDETGLGLFADPAQVSVVYAANATVTTAGGYTTLGYFGRYLGAYGISQADFETAMGTYLAGGGANPVTSVADPVSGAGTANKTVAVSFDHFGARLVASVTEAYWFVHFY
jgi:hypothetical protein